MECSLYVAHSSVHGIFQARVLEWVAISFSRGSSQPRDWTRVSRIVGRRFTVWATRIYNSKGLIRTNYTSQMEKAMATHSSTLAWKIPWTEEPARLQSTGLLRVGHNWATSLSLSTFMHWRRAWQPTLVFLPEASQGWWSLVGCRLWGRTESDVTEVT